MAYTSVMNKRKKNRPLYQRIAFDIAGFGLMIAAPFLGWLPGPGGIPMFVAGLGLVALNHEWAENMLRDFEKKREAYTEKYLMASPKVSLTIDIAGLLIMVAGAFVAINTTSSLIRLIAFGSISLTIIVLLSNQKRFERIWTLIKKQIQKN